MSTAVGNMDYTNLADRSHTGVGVGKNDWRPRSLT